MLRRPSSFARSTQAARKMGCCNRQLLDHKLSLPSLTEHSISCRSSSRATLLRFPTAQVPLKLSKAPRFSSDLFVDTGLLKVRHEVVDFRGGCGHGGVNRITCASAYFSSETLRWIFTGAASLLIFLRNTTFKKALLVPMLALQAPQDVVTWVRGEYGMWAAFLALLLRLFYYIPGELELPLAFVLLVITAPYQALDLRLSTAGLVTCVGLAAFLAYQHFSTVGGAEGAFKGSAFLASIAVVLLVAIPCVFLFGVI